MQVTEKANYDSTAQNSMIYTKDKRKWDLTNIYYTFVQTRNVCQAQPGREIISSTSS